MDKALIMREYNHFERKSAQPAGYHIVDTGEVLRLVSDSRHGSFISYYAFSERRADEIIDQEMAFFTAKDREFEWKVYETDSPSCLGKRLERKGFIKQDSESFMVLDLAHSNHGIRQVSGVTEVMDPQGIADAISVQQAVWGGDFSGLQSYLIQTKQERAEDIRIFVVYRDNRPVASAWIVFNGDSPFAGIWGGSTLKEYRGQGIYTALLNHRMALAKERRKNYLIIDASEMSRPIVEKYGFMKVATTTPYLFTP